MRPPPNCLKFFVLLAALGTFLVADNSAPTVAPAQPEPLEAADLHNVFRVTEGVYSGSSPESEAGIRELARLGVKVIISVDGAKPPVELARKHGLRYIHLPIGYDGVPEKRAAELAKAASVADGPVYVHCHHGKHRGPAAAAVVCRAVKQWSPERAKAYLEQAGTSADYAGLYRDVEKFVPPSAKALEEMSVELPETAPTPPLVDAMVEIDERFEMLKAAQKVDWRATPGNESTPPAHAATLLWELLRELGREPETTAKGADYAVKMKASEEAANALRELLRNPTGTIEARAAAMKKIGTTCGACHKAHRN